MTDPVRMVLCPVCRQAVPDAAYYAHAKKHQQSGRGLLIAVLGVAVLMLGLVAIVAMVMP